MFALINRSHSILFTPIPIWVLAVFPGAVEDRQSVAEDETVLVDPL